VAGGGKRISPDEVARHAVADDCWMVINGAVHDITSCLPEHPSNSKTMVRWRGKEATAAYRSKTAGGRIPPSCLLIFVRLTHSGKRKGKQRSQAAIRARQ
jgi:cytochrome b involved in lipid metabolism